MSEVRGRGRLHPLTVITIFPEPEFYLSFVVGGLVINMSENKLGLTPVLSVQ